MDVRPYLPMFQGTYGQCWELVRIVLKEEFGISLPRYQDELPGVAFDEKGWGPELWSAVGLHDEWRKVSAPPYQEGDVCFFRLGRCLHVGIAINGDQMLHAVMEVGVIVSKLSDPMWQTEGISLGVYRHRSQ